MQVVQLPENSFIMFMQIILGNGGESVHLQQYKRMAIPSFYNFLNVKFLAEALFVTVTPALILPVTVICAASA
jgi:hypothetical protein